MSLHLSSKIQNDVSGAFSRIYSMRVSIILKAQLRTRRGSPSHSSSFYVTSILLVFKKFLSLEPTHITRGNYCIAVRKKSLGGSVRSRTFFNPILFSISSYLIQISDISDSTNWGGTFGKLKPMC